MLATTLTFPDCSNHWFCWAVAAVDRPFERLLGSQPQPDHQIDRSTADVISNPVTSELFNHRVRREKGEKFIIPMLPDLRSQKNPVLQPMPLATDLF
ncbi:MAG: hypothetical protein LH628_24105 [Microcoleus sp. CAN_BIN18]|nr:hypothetical protein [Microcoleus sp. CAN_BIN18]